MKQRYQIRGDVKGGPALSSEMLDHLVDRLAELLWGVVGGFGMGVEIDVTAREVTESLPRDAVIAKALAKRDREWHDAIGSVDPGVATMYRDPWMIAGSLQAWYERGVSEAAENVRVRGEPRDPAEFADCLVDDVHPLEADEFEDLLTDYRLADRLPGARATCDELTRVRALIVEYVKRHYRPKERVEDAGEDLFVHVCGMQGFGAPGDICLVCREKS